MGALKSASTRPRSALSQSYPRKFDPIAEIETAETMTALDEAIQKSLNRIKKNMLIKGDDDCNTESSSTVLDRTRTPVNHDLVRTSASAVGYPRAASSAHAENLVSAIKKETAEITENLEQENIKRRVNLLKYELEAEQKSSTAKITVLTEELKTSKELIDSASQKNFELQEELKALNERLEVEIEKNFELSKTLKNKVGFLVNEIDNFRKFEKDVEKSLEEKEKRIDQLGEENQEKEDEIENLKEAYAKQLSNLKDDLADARSSYERNLNNLTEQNRVERENLVETLTKRHDQTMKLMHKKYQDEKELGDYEISTLKVKLKEREQDHETDHRKQKNDFDEKIEARVKHERSLAESEKDEAMRRQQMRYEDELETLRKRLNDELDIEKRRGMESERLIESLRQELASAKDDLANLQRESVDAIKETQKACEAASQMKLSELRDELNDDHTLELQNRKADFQAALKDKQTADLDIKRLTNKMAEIESVKLREQKKVISRINKVCFDISASIGIQSRQVFIGPAGGDSTMNGTTRDDTVLGGGGSVNYDLLVKSGLDNLSVTAREVIEYSKNNEFRIQQIREQFATYQAQRDTEPHLENETDRMIEFAKERLHQKYVRDLDELRTEIRRDNDIETALRKTVDRQHSALLGLMKTKKSSHKIANDDTTESADISERNRRNIRRLTSLNTKVNYLNKAPGSQ